MNLQKQKKLGLLFLALGVVLLGAQLALESSEKLSFTSGLLSGVSACFLAVGAARLLRWRRIARSPEAAADYEAAYTDERIAYVAGKARAMTFYIFVFVQLFGGLLALYVFHQKTVGMVLCCLTSLQCLTYIVLYRLFGKKY